MSTPEDVTPAQPAVRFSRVMGLRWVTALGSGVSVGLGVYILLGVVTQAAGRQHVGWSYILLAITAIPIILTYAERGAVLQGGGGALNLVRTGRYVWMLYGSAWLLLGGYIALVAVLGWGAALHLDILTEYFFGLSFDLPLSAAAIIGIFALLSIFGTSWSGRSKGTYVYVCIIFLFLVIVRGFFATSSADVVARRGSGASTQLGVTALMVASLWGLQFILNVRDEIYRPTRTLFSAMLITVGFGCGLGFLAGWAIIRYGSTALSLIPLIDIVAGFGVIPEELLIIFYAWFGFTISLVVLNQAIVHSLRLIGNMNRDGFVPERVQNINAGHNAPIIALALLAIFSIFLVVLLPFELVLGLAAITFLWVTALVHLPDALKSKTSLPENRFPKLPFHPLFPWLTISIGVFLPFNLPMNVWMYTVGWILVGAVYYWSYARRRGFTMFRQEVVVGEISDVVPEAEEEYVVLVGISHSKTALSLLRAGARLAQARDGVLLALRVLTLSEQMPVHLKREAARKEWEKLSALLKQVEITGVRVKPLVRLAPSPVSGILEAVREEGVDLIFLGWESTRPPDDIILDPILDPIVKRADCDVAILHGTYPQEVQRILVSTAGGPHAPVALGLGQDLVTADDPQIYVEHMVVEYLSPEVTAAAEANLETTLQVVKNGQPVEQRIREVDSVKDGILRNAQNADLLLLGVSKQGVLEQSFFGGFPKDVAQASPIPTILARKRESTGRFGVRRLVEMITDVLPNLTVNQQADVFQTMRESAQPSIDFFVLISLSAVIATLGLLQNSAAVIIGAMLVAPLMSPILAMAMSMVKGNLRLLAVAAEATAKGVALAITVGIIMVLVSPIDQPTNEILARTQPNVLDLMVALASGAAAGYAISRKEVAAALPGVAIAAALVPPLCVVGYGLGTSQLEIAGGSLLLFITNLIAIVLAAALTFLALGFQPPRDERSELMRGLRVTVISLLIVSIILLSATVSSIRQLNRQNKVNDIFQQKMVAQAVGVLETTISREGEGFTIDATVISYEDTQMTSAQMAELEAELSEAVDGPVTVNIVVISGLRGKLDEAEIVRSLEMVLEKEVESRSGKVFDSKFEERIDDILAVVTVIALSDDQFNVAALADIQSALSEEAPKPVKLELTVLPARHLVAPTPTPEQAQ